MATPDLAPSPLALRLFGPFTVEVNGAPLPRLRSRRGEWLLSLLVLRAHQPVGRSWLAGTLWPESSDRQALTNLRVSLKDLRRALGPEATRLRSPSSHMLMLELDGADVDLLQFDAAIARGDERALAAAVALYRGPLLEGCLEAWAFEARQRREQAYLDALEQLGASARERGELAKAESYLRRVVAVNPLREGAQRALMQVLAAAGSYAAALQVYRELRLLLHRELNAAPDAETQALFLTLRDGPRPPAPLAPPRDPARSAPGGDSGPSSEEIPDTEPGQPAHNLPCELTSFIGREREIAEVRRFFGTTRLLTLTGAGGCGKTRLALRVAADLREEHADGVWLVELAALADSALVPQTVASALGVREEPGQPLIATLTDHLQPKSLLLVLDNCEHLLEACAQLADALLRSCPRLRLLAASRGRLGIAGERTYRVPSLSLPPPGQPLPVERLKRYEAVRLFVERAVFTQPDFVVTEQNAPAVVQVCERLDGIPLAIELAAARLNVLPVEQIAARLDDMFRLLTGGSRAALARHQTLRALIDWSYHLLTEPEQTLLQRLSVFAGGWTLEAAEAVCADQVDGRWLMVDSSGRSGPSTINYQLSTHEVLGLLAGLVEKSLVLYEERGSRGRYRLLETIRQYGRDRLLEGGRSDAVRQHHLDFFVRMAEEALPVEMTARAKRQWLNRVYAETASAQQEWIDRLETDHDNLSAALAWAVESGEAERGLRLGAALWRFWFWQAYASEGQEQLARVLALPYTSTHTARADALFGAGAHTRMYHLELFGAGAHTRMYYLESLARFRELGDEYAMASCYHALGLLARGLGDYEEARTLYEESLALWHRLGDADGAAGTLNDLGAVAYLQLDYPRARSLLNQSLAITRAQGPRFVMGWSLTHLGEVADAEGDYEAADAFLEESLRVWRDLGYESAIVFALMKQGRVARRQGHWQRACSRLRESLTRFRRPASQEGVTDCLEEVAAVAAAQEQPARAARLLGAAEAQREAGGWPIREPTRADRERTVALVRGALGEPLFAAAWAEGRTMPLEAAVSFALKDLDPASPPHETARPIPSDETTVPAAETSGTGAGEPSHNLPYELTSFVGREREMEEIRYLFRSSRLLTLTGAGGCGKTRLALRVAADLLAEHADGVWLVPLAALTDPALVPQTVATALGIREEASTPLIQTLAAALKPKRPLLVLDNCEHLVGACAALAEALLRSCPHLRILATSREGLGIQGEITFRVPSLSVPRVQAFRRSGVQGLEIGPPERLLEYEAVRLFTERAGFSQPSFALTPRNAGAVVQICQRLDGIPLAIELAAARVKALPVEQIAARLDDRFRLLTGGNRAALPQHRTLRDCIDWSYDLLSEAERVLLRRLSVFSGGWTLEAAEAVCNSVDSGQWIVDSVGAANANAVVQTGPSTVHYPPSTGVLELLAALVEKSLVLYEEREGAGGAEGAGYPPKVGEGPDPGRYRLLETVRQYARDRLLEAGEADAMEERHCDWCLALAEQADHRGGLDRLEREHDNLRAALSWCRTSGVQGRGREAWGRSPGPRSGGPGHSGVQEETTCGAERLNAKTPERLSLAEKGLRLGGALAWLWEQRCYFREGYEHLAGILALPGAQARTAARAKALAGAGHLVWYQRKFEAAQALFEESLTIFRELGDESGIAFSLFRLAGVAESLRGPGAGRALHEESLGIKRRICGQGRIAWSLYAIGRAAMSQGDFGTGRALTEESLSVFRENGSKGAIGWSLYNLGWMTHAQGDYEAAQALLEESLANFQEFGNQNGVAMSLGLLGDVIRDQGEHEPARELYQQSLVIFRELGDMESIAVSLERLGEVACDRGDSAAARAFLTEMEALGREWGDQGSMSELCLSQGHLLLRLGDHAAARSRYEAGLALRRAEGRTWYVAAALLEAGHAAWLQGEPAVMEAYALEAAELFQALDDKGGILCALESLAVAALTDGSQERAARLLGAVAARRETAGAVAALRSGHLTVSGTGWWRRRERMGEAVRAASLQETFAGAWAEGRAMSLEEALPYALEDG